MISMQTITHVIDHYAENSPNKIALINAKTGQRLTYAEVTHSSRLMARHLYREGISVGQVAAYLINDPLSIVTVILALGRLRAAFTPLNPHTEPHQWTTQLTDANASAIIYDPSFESDVLSLAPPMDTIRIVSSYPLVPRLDSVDEFEPAFEDDRFALLYTSGTTGRPKGAWHTQKTFWGWNECLKDTLSISAEDRIFNPYPYFHMGGIGFTLAALQWGNTVIIDTPFNPLEAVKSLSRYQCTTAFMVPTMAQAILDLPHAEQEVITRSDLHHIVTTSAPLMAHTERTLARLWPGIERSVLYSATEAIFSARVRSISNNTEGTTALCVGAPASGMDISIRHSESDPCAPGSIGTIYCRGLSVFSGYHHAIRPRTPDSWFTCNDLGYINEMGDLVLVDRAQDIINSGGEKISSLEIENVLRTHPRIRDVAVVGRQDRYWGERIHAVIVVDDATLTASEITQYARKCLPAFKVPKSIDMVSQLPRGETGKVLKSILREGR